MKKILFIFTILFLTTVQLFCKINKNKPYIWSHSDGKGSIQLFWLPNKLWSQGGWKLEKIQNGKITVLAYKIFPGSNKKTLSKFSFKEIEHIKKLAKQIKSGKMKGQNANLAKFVFGSKAASDINFGLALGLRYNDNSKTKGYRVYRISALNKNGKVIAQTKSKNINPYKKSKPPLGIKKIKANVTLDGVFLYWKKPKLDKNNPVVGYDIQRVDPDGSVEKLNDKTLIVAQNIFKNNTPVMIDKNAPVEKSVVYRVYSVGFFGNKSKPANVKVFIEDLSALMSPEKFKIKGGKKIVSLTWKKNQSPYCAGYILERSYLSKGPYAVITPKGLRQSVTEYIDKNLKGGTTYYYRIKSINIRGKIGKPSYAKMAVPTSGNKPPVITGLKADVGISEIKLSWNKPKVDVAGYLVYRRPSDRKKWSLLNNYVISDEFYEDSYSAKTYGAFDYRIVTVGNDTLQSKSSKSIHVKLIDSISPNPPYITDINPNNGKVKINFKAAPPYEDTDYFLLIRSVSLDDPGLVIGDKIPVSKHEIVDKFVKYGQRYWYRLVAVDKSGNRSGFSRARTIVVQNPPIPIPEKPKLTYKSEPIPHVTIEIHMIPKRMVAIIQKKQNGEWSYVATATDTVPVTDLKINKNERLSYRILYRAENGVEGKTSKSVDIKINEK